MFDQTYSYFPRYIGKLSLRRVWLLILDESDNMFAVFRDSRCRRVCRSFAFAGIISILNTPILSSDSALCPLEYNRTPYSLSNRCP